MSDYLIPLVFGWIMAVLIIGLISDIPKVLEESKILKKIEDYNEKSIDGFLEAPAPEELSSFVNAHTTVIAKEDLLAFRVAYKFMKPYRFSVPYEKVSKFELCGELPKIDTKPDYPDFLDSHPDYPDRFIIEYIDNNDKLQKLSFKFPDRENANIYCLYPEHSEMNIIDTVHERMKIAQEKTNQTTDTSNK